MKASKPAIVKGCGAGGSGGGTGHDASQSIQEQAGVSFCVKQMDIKSYFQNNYY